MKKFIKTFSAPLVMMCLMLTTMFATSNQAFSQCVKPTMLNAVSSDATTEVLSWNAVAGGTSYEFEVQNGEGAPAYEFSNTVDTTSYTLTGLIANSNYKFKVRTNCGGNHSNWTMWFLFTTGGGGGNCTIAPTGLVVSLITSSGAKLNWNSTGAPNYKVRVEDGSGNPVDFTLIVKTATAFYNVTGLNSSSMYKFKVRAVCTGVTGPWSMWKNFTTAPLRISAGAEVSENEMVIYPNPASEEINIQLTGENIASENAQIAIYDITGKQVIAQQYAGNAEVQNIAVAKLPAGLYQVIFISGEQRITQRVSIVK